MTVSGEAAGYAFMHDTFMDSYLNSYLIHGYLQSTFLFFYL